MSLHLTPARIIAGPPVAALAVSVLLDMAGCTGLAWWQLWVAGWLIITAGGWLCVGILTVISSGRQRHAER